MLALHKYTYFNDSTKLILLSLFNIVFYIRLISRTPKAEWARSALKIFNVSRGTKNPIQILFRIGSTSIKDTISIPCPDGPGSMV
jgi:hypothetical protein